MEYPELWQSLEARNSILYETERFTLQKRGFVHNLAKSYRNVTAQTHAHADRSSGEMEVNTKQSSC